jgi:hypothetical protein
MDYASPIQKELPFIIIHVCDCLGEEVALMTQWTVGLVASVQAGGACHITKCNTMVCPEQRAAVGSAFIPILQGAV